MHRDDQRIPWWRGVLGRLIYVPGIIVSPIGTAWLVNHLAGRLIVTLCYDETAWRSGLRAWLKPGTFSNGTPLPHWAYLEYPLILVTVTLSIMATYMIAMWVAGEDFADWAEMNPRNRRKRFKPPSPRESSIPEKFRDVAANVDSPWKPEKKE